MATVLVVEDNLLNMELVTDLLEGAGHTVRQEFSAEEGIVAATAEHPQLILMDVRLPGIDGREAVRRLKRDPSTADIPTVALTAQAMAGDRESILAAGFDAYITKPIDTRAFINSLQRFLEPGGST